MGFDGFTQEFFAFYDELGTNNERAWFQENKPFYERAVQTPMLRFIEAMGPRLAEISKHLLADPRRNGGSMFRIYRDTRFSKDKTPYKTHCACQFRHVLGKDVHAPGLYMHFSQREFVLGGGIWRPSSAELEKIRTYIDENPEQWIRARDNAEFRAMYELGGESLKRPPKGYAADHPLLVDLKRKDFVAMRAMMPPDLLREDLLDEVARSYMACKPFIKFLCDALGLPF